MPSITRKMNQGRVKTPTTYILSLGSVFCKRNKSNFRFLSHVKTGRDVDPSSCLVKPADSCLVRHSDSCCQNGEPSLNNRQGLDSPSVEFLRRINNLLIRVVKLDLLAFKDIFCTPELLEDPESVFKEQSASDSYILHIFAIPIRAGPGQRAADSHDETVSNFL